MKAENFCYWLRGFLELNENLDSINKDQIKIINQHLDLVLKPVTKGLYEGVKVNFDILPRTDDLICLSDPIVQFVHEASC